MGEATNVSFIRHLFVYVKYMPYICIKLINAIMIEQSNKVRVVIINENTFALQHPNTVRIDILNASVLKGATFSVWPEPTHIHPRDTVRLATEEDFNEYRIEFTQYASRPDEYEIQR